MKRGDIVLALMPQAAGAQPKNRPALVVQADYYNRRISNVLLATITGNLTRRGDPAHYFVDVQTSDGKRSGLTRNSLVSCLNLAVLPKPHLGPRIGELSPAAMQQIDSCLRAALGI